MSRQRNNYTQLFIFLVIASLTLVFGDNNGWWKGWRSFVESKIVARRVNHAETPVEKLAQLESKVLSLEHTSSELTSENESLRKQLASPLPPKLRFIPGYVIAVEVTGEEALLKIAVGERDGVEEGMGVVSEAVLLGFVTQVSQRISTVRLLSSANSRVSVVTSGGARGLIVGTDEKNRPDNATLDRVLQTETLKVGDLITTSGEDNLPPSLVIGQVTEIVSESRDAFQKARVSLGAKPATLRRVFIVTDNL